MPLRKSILGIAYCIKTKTYSSLKENLKLFWEEYYQHTHTRQILRLMWVYGTPFTYLIPRLIPEKSSLDIQFTCQIRYPIFRFRKIIITICSFWPVSDKQPVATKGHAFSFVPKYPLPLPFSLLRPINHIDKKRLGLLSLCKHFFQCRTCFAVDFSVKEGEFHSKSLQNLIESTTTTHLLNFSSQKFNLSSFEFMKPHLLVYICACVIFVYQGRWRSIKQSEKVMIGGLKPSTTTPSMLSKELLLYIREFLILFLWLISSSLPYITAMILVGIELGLEFCGHVSKISSQWKRTARFILFGY